LGTYDFPYKTMTQAKNSVLPGGKVAFKTVGHSAETLSIPKAMTIVATGGPATLGR
jgi:hypothetical protein